MQRRLRAWSSQNSQDIPVHNIVCKGEGIKQVGTFKYLGFTITPDARFHTETDLACDDDDDDDQDNFIKQCS